MSVVVILLEVVRQPHRADVEVSQRMISTTLHARLVLVGDVVDYIRALQYLLLLPCLQFIGLAVEPNGKTAKSANSGTVTFSACHYGSLETLVLESFPLVGGVTVEFLFLLSLELTVRLSQFVETVNVTAFALSCNHEAVSLVELQRFINLVERRLVVTRLAALAFACVDGIVVA